MSDRLESLLDSERRAACIANDLKLQPRQHNRMEELRQAYIKLVCVMITMMAIAFVAGFALAKVTTDVHPVQIVPSYTKGS